MQLVINDTTQFNIDSFSKEYSPRNEPNYNNVIRITFPRGTDFEEVKDSLAGYKPLEHAYVEGEDGSHEGLSDYVLDGINYQKYDGDRKSETLTATFIKSDTI